MTRKDAHKSCLDRDCSCIESKDRDNNYHETINKLYDDFEKKYGELCEKFAKVLDYSSGSRCSNPETDINIIYETIDRKVQTEINYAIDAHIECYS